MMELANFDLVPIVVAALIGIVIGWWMFRRIRAAGKAAPARDVAPPPSAMADDREGNSIADEQAAAVADVVGEVLGVEVHAEIPAAEGPPDNLQTMKGVGPKLAARLAENGVTRFDQIAALSPAQAQALDARMGPFAGRIARDRLVEQASYLARGDTAGFQAAFGNLGSGQPG